MCEIKLKLLRLENDPGLSGCNRKGPYEEVSVSESEKGDVMIEPEVTQRDLEMVCCWP